MNNNYSSTFTFTFTFIRKHFHFCVFTLFILSQKYHCVDPFYEACAPMKYCGQHEIRYPFYIQGQNSSCGFPGFELNCTNYGLPILHLDENNYIVDRIFYSNRSIRVYNAAVLSAGTNCLPQIRNLSLVGNNRFSFVNHLAELVLFANCSTNLPSEILMYRVDQCWDLAILRGRDELGVAMEECEVHVAAPVEVHGGDGVEEYGELMKRGFLLNWTATNCSECEESGGRCGFDYPTYNFRCLCTDRPHFRRCQSSKNSSKVILAAVIPGGFIITICVLVFIVCRRHKWNYVTYILSRNASSDPSSNEDLEGGSVYFGVPVFSYRELEEATKNFDPSKELGDGGFGTVYHGKLRDGREVAVKRLYEHNYKRVEQFMNEVQILTRMRHRNLVLLYGCTSRRSRELLLVYEYIPNGTVADHLHGDRVKTGSLTWPIRMNIAIETASALAYLHASDIIHRDVKTNNILLDTNFCVKVADFGLSRLFPNDVTHVSTAPQGTPGYVDPEYHQCYQLTDKSDVYSFGVVLIELISSMPAVDISRHRDEINLANLAINKIQKSAFHELIDPCLGFQSDGDVERMTTSVAELAFRCLQLEKEMRPKMEEVLEALKGIKGDDDEYKVEKTEEGDDYVDGAMKNVRPPPSPESDEVVLLKNSKPPPSPDTVTAKWVSSSSSSTIPATSG